MAGISPLSAQTLTTIFSFHDHYVNLNEITVTIRTKFSWASSFRSHMGRPPFSPLTSVDLLTFKGLNEVRGQLHLSLAGGRGSPQPTRH